MVIVVFGVPGSGKTSIIKGILETMEITRIGWNDIVREIAFDRNLITQIDQLRYLNVSIQKELQPLVVDAIGDLIDKDPNKNYLIETHALMKTPQGFFPGLPRYFRERVKADVLILVEADPTVILERRKRDTTRKREDDKTIDSLKQHMELTRSITTAYSATTGANVLIVNNEEDKLEETISGVRRILETYL
jgi:adenylate kinase